MSTKEQEAPCAAIWCLSVQPYVTEVFSPKSIAPREYLCNTAGDKACHNLFAYLAYAFLWVPYNGPIHLYGCHTMALNNLEPKYSRMHEPPDKSFSDVKVGHLSLTNNEQPGKMGNNIKTTATLRPASCQVTGLVSLQSLMRN